MTQEPKENLSFLQVNTAIVAVFEYMDNVFQLKDVETLSESLQQRIHRYEVTYQQLNLCKKLLEEGKQEEGHLLLRFIIMQLK